MKLILAPMEGVVDFPMRKAYTALGGFDLCVTEFLRITDRLLPEKCFLQLAPELAQGGKTKSLIPIMFQLLGGQPEPLRDNALRAVDLGALGIDLNFGCPAKTVNRHDGGAALLQEPRRLEKIISEVRRSVPESIPVTAKVRLGYQTADGALDIAQAVESGGANWITVHARTKKDGYKPPAHWHWLKKIKQEVNIPVVGNGDIWTVEDFIRCHDETQCDHYMLGRGAIAHPFLANQIREILSGGKTSSSNWQMATSFFLPVILEYAEKSSLLALSRLKQWLRQLGRQYPEAQILFEKIKRTKEWHDLPVEFEGFPKASSEVQF